MARKMSAIATSTTATVLAQFAGQTVTDDAVYEAIENSYAMANKRAAFGSFADILVALDVHHGVRTVYSGPNYTGQASYVFPAAA